MKKRILSLFLALAITAPMIPVMAENGDGNAAADEKTVTEMTEEFPVIAEEDAQQPAEGEGLPENGEVSENEKQTETMNPQTETINPFEDSLPIFGLKEITEQTEIEDGTEDEIELMAATDVAEDFAWELSEDGTLTISGNGAMPNWQMITYVPWYNKMKRIKKVILTEGITSVSKYAFTNCEYLNSITIPNTVTTVYSYAFEDCYKLDKINISDMIAWCNTLVIGTIRSHDLYLNGELVTNLIIPDCVTHVGANLFSGCKNLTSVKIPNTVTSIERCAFYGSPNITQVEIPDSITKIGYGAFLNTGMKNIYISDIEKWCNIYFDGFSMNTYDLYVNNEKLTELTIPDGITKIGAYSFNTCRSLTKVTIPEEVTDIGAYAFSACTGLTSVTIPGSVTSIANYTFGGCTNLNKVTIQNGVTTIGNCTFNGCTGLTSVTIPDSVTTIGDSAFNGCTGLTSITIPGSVTSIANDTFNGCTNLNKVTIQNGVTTIGDSAFFGCTGLTSVTIPDSVTSIGQGVFSGCTDMTDITIPGSVTSMGMYAFSGCKGLKNITISNGVTSIGYFAFYNCTGLTSITIPGSVTSIGSSAFLDCTGLTSVNIEKGVKTIKSSAFAGCTGLTDITIPDSVISIKDRVFWGCPSLTEITIPDSVKSIEDATFYYCTGLTKIIIPDSVKSIGGAPFYGCYSLVIYCHLGSYAEQYAIDNKIKYEYLQDETSSMISIIVQDSESMPITEGVTVNWYEKDGDSIIGTGTELKNIDEEKQYEYEIILNEDLSRTYYQPERTDFVIEGENYEKVVKLEKIPEITVSGKVIDDNNAIKNREVEFVQTFANGYTNSVTAATDENGKYSVKLLNVPTVAKIKSSGYYSRTKTVLSERTVENKLDMGEISLVKLPSNKITLSMSRKAAVSGDANAMVSQLFNANNISFILHNDTQNNDITDFELQYPNIILKDSDAAANDTISISAADEKGNMTAQTAVFTLDELKNGSCDIEFIENGSVRINSVSGNSANTVMVFNENGDFVKSYSVNTSLKTDNMPEGSYTFVFITRTDLLQSVPKLETLSEFGLSDGADYITKAVNIENGKITEIENVTVPVLDETKLYYTVSENTSFTANNTEVSVARYVAMRCEYEIAGKHETSGETIKISLPENVSFANSSLTVDGRIAPYTIDGNTLTVVTNKKKAVVRFYVVATDKGEYDVNASLLFNKSGSMVVQPVGTAKFTANVGKISAPEKTGQKNITVSGTTMGNSNVIVYDNDTEVGKVTANANGNWQLKFELVKPYNYSYHDIYAVIENKSIGKPISTEVCQTLYDTNWIEPSKVTMINTAHSATTLAAYEFVTEFNFINPGKTSSYRIWPSKYPTFTFKLEFTGGDDTVLSDVYVVTKNAAGECTYVPMKYDKNTGIWLGTHDYNASSSAPASVSVIYKRISSSSEFDVDSSLTEQYKNELIKLNENAKEAVNNGEMLVETISDDIDTDTALGEKKIKYSFLDGNGEYTDIYTDFKSEKINPEDIDLSEYICINTDGKKGYAKFVITDTDIILQTYDPATGILETVTCRQNDSEIALMSAASTWNNISGALGFTGIALTIASFIPQLAILKNIWIGISVGALGYGAGYAGGSMLNDEIAEVEEYFDMQDELCHAQYGIEFEIMKRQTELIGEISSFLGVASTVTGIAAIGAFVPPMLIISLGTGGLSALMASSLASQTKELQHFKEKISKECDSGWGKPGTSASGNDKRFIRSRGYTMTYSVRTTPVIDPSGYVYEAVPSNRIEGVKAEVYQYDYPIDEFGVQKENKEEILWNAEDYDQQNPLYTDKNGMYMWDVPAGQWLVKFSKDGYFDTDSRKDAAADSDGYLPVPPPQTEVNTAIVSKSAPTVESVNAYNDEVQIIFSQYMNIASVNTDNIKVFANGDQISGTISPSDAEFDYKGENQYAKTFVFTPNTSLSGEASVTVKNVKNYTGKAIESEYQKKAAVTIKPSEIAVNDTISIKYGSGALAEIEILPKEAGKNKTLTASSASPSIVEVVNSTVVTDENGKANVMLSGILPGEAEITVKLDGTDITKTFKAVVGNVENVSNKCEKVNASIESGSTVEKGTRVTLKTATEGADIYYTTDGTCPCTLGSASRIKYTAPIEINDYTFIIAYAVKDGMEDSSTQGFIYNVAKTAEKVKTPLANPKGGSVSSGTNVSLSCDTENAVIYYTTDGTTPSTSSAKYTAPISVTKAVTIKAVAVKGSMTDSDIMSESYTVSTGGGYSGGGGGSSSKGGSAPTIPNVKTEPIENKNMKFTDVSESDWFYNAVKFAFERGITSGVSETEYAPQNKVTRAQFITMLCRAYNIPEMTGDNFADCGNTWYTGYLAAAKQKGISNGVGDNRFAPDKEITREEMVALIYNYLKSVGEINGKKNTTSFADDSDISDWAKAAVAYAAENGIVKGKNENKFDPKGNATRAELAQIFFNILKTE